MTPAQREIIESVAARHNVCPDDIVGASRRRAIARARQEVMYVMRRDGRWSTPMIGRVLGARDHATVIFGAAAHARRAAEDLAKWTGLGSGVHPQAVHSSSSS